MPLAQVAIARRMTRDRDRNGSPYATSYAPSKMKEKRTTEKDRSLTFEIAQASPPTDLVVITTKSA
jgi:hypothetical protein